MDDLDKRLKEDAARIDANVPAALRARIDAGVGALASGSSRYGMDPLPRRFRLGGLIGFCAALLLVAYLGSDGFDLRPDRDRSSAAATGAMPLPPLADLPLDVRTAEFAAPLDDELRRLRSDIDTVRERLGEDLSQTL